MPNLMVRNVPQELYDKLRASAEDHRRSINSEVIVSLEKVLCTTRIDPEEFLKGIHELQRELKLPRLTKAFLRTAKEQGRP